jgi:iron complex outermembrane recepter protein
MERGFKVSLRSSFKSSTSLNLVIFATGVAFVTPAFAQSTAAPQPAPAEQPAAGAVTVSEVIVTAQRRNENLQKVPLTVQAFSAAQLSEAGITSTVDLARITPGLVFGRGVALGSPFLRGVGTGANGPGVENTVAVYVDGVYYASKSSAITDLENVERVEVLKGPQGTLFGRNASGGLIQIITTDPTSTPELKMKAGYGNFDTATLSGFVNHAITDDLAFNLGASYQDQGQGWGKNLATGHDVNLTDKFNTRGKLKWDVSPSTTVTLIGDYAYFKSSVGIAIRPLDGLKPRQAGLFEGGDYDISSNIDPIFKSHVGGLALKVDHDFGFAKLVSTTAWRSDAYSFLVDGDATATPYLTSQIDAHETQYSQEFQLSGGSASTLLWTSGVYLFLYDGKQYVLNSGNIYPGFDYKGTYGRLRANSEAAYGQVTKELLPDTRLTLGVRYTWEEREINGNTVQSLADVSSSGAVTTAQTSYRKPTWRIALEHDFAKDVLGYVSYNRGFKSGTYNTGSPSSPPVQPEVVDAYETGLKTSLFNRLVRLNTAAFYSDFKNIQLTSFGLANIQILRNAARAKIYGLDNDFEIVPTRNLRFSGSAEWLHARYTDFPGAPSATPDLINGGNIVTSQSASGHHLIRAPDFTANLMGDYWLPVKDGSVDLSVSYTYTGRTYQEVDNYLYVPAMFLLNAQLSWSIDRRYKISLWGRNLTDKFYFANSSALAQASSGAAAEPRTYGVSVEAKF